MHYVIHWMGRHQDFIYIWFIKYQLLGCQSVIVVSNEVNTEMTVYLALSRHLCDFVKL